MAGADYYHCAVCGGKAFYDANIDWEYQHVGRDPEDDWNGPLSRPPYLHGVSVVALCADCWKTHEIKVVRRDGT